MKVQTERKIVKVTNKDFEIKDPITKKVNKVEPFEFSVSILTYKQNMLLIEQFSTEEQNKDNLLDYAKELWTQSITDWKDIFDENGNVLQCNDSNKRALFEYNTVFCQSILEQATKHLQAYKKK